MVTSEKPRLLEMAKTPMAHLMRSVLFLLSVKERIHMINKMISMIEERKILQGKKRGVVAHKIIVRIHKICTTRY